MHNNRGSIINKDVARQLREYKGIRYGNITPTDIDGFIEYHNNAYIFIELKLGNAVMSSGQRLAFERLTDDLEYRKPTLFIIASHNAYDPNEDIDAANAYVTEYRFKREWLKFSPESLITTKEIIDLFLDNLEIESKDFKLLCDGNLRTKTNLSQFMED